MDCCWEAIMSETMGHPITCEFVIRRGTEADVAQVLAIEAACVEAPHWEERHYAAIVQVPAGSLQQRVLLAAEWRGEIVAYTVASLVADQAELESIAVLPGARRQGIGRALCGAAIRWAVANGAEHIVLEVRSANAAAQAMYSQLGFVNAGLRKGYYSHPTDDAVLMASKLQAELNL
jgi:[ribosomal protein S18]-alanine N-acetyltransferase